MPLISGRVRLAGLLLLMSRGVYAQFAVIDVASVTQLVQQAQTMAAQLEAARGQLTQAQAQYQALTGDRGMESLLSGIVRNYLPTNWSQLSAVLAGSGDYGGLAATMQASLGADAILSASQIALLTPDERSQINSARQSIALLQALTQNALGNASGRFTSIQQLINAIPTAHDPKGILDLQARIGAEEGMLQNEQNKLQVLFETALAQEWSVQQRQREQIVADHGRFATRFEPVP